MLGAIQVFEKRGKKLVYQGDLTARDLYPPVTREKKTNRRTLADVMMDEGPELALPPRLAIAASEQPKQRLSWYDLRYPRSWKERSWKRQTRRDRQYRFGWPMPA